MAAQGAAAVATVLPTSYTYFKVCATAMPFSRRRIALSARPKHLFVRDWRIISFPLRSYCLSRFSGGIVAKVTNLVFGGETHASGLVISLLELPT